MSLEALRERAHHFASLQAAHRGLARSVHPSELGAVREQSRALLIELQELSSGDAVSPDALARVDEALAEQTERTRAWLEDTELPQLRASLPALVAQHRDEVEGLLDVILVGDLSDGRHLRTLEYLATLLAVEERDGRRVVVRAPGEVSPRLAAITEEHQRTEDGEACLIGERVFEDASAALMQGEEIGALRDRVRRYKDGLGTAVLHPRTLAAAIAYNVAMWNHVAAEIDSSRAIEQLAAELFGDARAEATAESALELEAGDAPEALPGVLGSRAFEDIVTAFAARIRGEHGGTSPARGIADALPLESLRSDDVEAFETEEPDEQATLIRHAIVLGLLLRQREGISQALADYGMTAESLSDGAAEDLCDRMAQLARKHFAQSQYPDAFRLSDVKMHSLGPFIQQASGAAEDDERGPKRRRRASTLGGPFGRLRQLGRTLTGGPAIALIIMAAIFAGIIYSPPILDDEPLPPSRSELEAISPFLEWGQEADGAEPRRFVGRLSAAWDYVETPQRREVAQAIGRHFDEQGIASVVLMDTSKAVVMRYAHGQVVLLTPRAEDD